MPPFIHKKYTLLFLFTVIDNEFQYQLMKGGRQVQVVVRKLLLFGIALGLVLTSFSMNVAYADSDYEDGVYSLEYVILHAENESASMANDYFEKPAYLIVENGKEQIRFTLNHSEWTTELKAPSGDDFIDVEVISRDEEEDTRIIEFELEQTLSEPVPMQMHVLIETMDPVYDHEYTVRFDFDLESLKELDEAEVEALGLDQTSDSNQLFVWIGIAALIIVLILLFILYRRRKKERNKR